METPALDIMYVNKDAQKLYQNCESNYGSADAAGFDLRAHIDKPVILQDNEQIKISTGIKLNLSSLASDAPDIFRLAAFILPRSGLGTKYGLTLANHVGLIDQDYQGEIFCTMRLRHDAPCEFYAINPGDRIAQLVILPIFRPQFNVVDDFAVTTQRGENGHGSTGVA